MNSLAVSDSLKHLRSNAAGHRIALEDLRRTATGEPAGDAVLYFVGRRSPQPIAKRYPAVWPAVLDEISAYVS